MSKEHCVLCDEETGNAGIHDGSLFPELLHPVHGIASGDTIGPLCNECYEALAQLEMILIED